MGTASGKKRGLGARPTEVITPRQAVLNRASPHMELATQGGSPSEQWPSLAWASEGGWASSPPQCAKVGLGRRAGCLGGGRRRTSSSSLIPPHEVVGGGPVDDPVMVGQRQGCHRPMTRASLSSMRRRPGA